MKSLLKISEAAVLALHTMALMANDPKTRLSNQKITEALGCSANTLAKVLQRLSRAGLLNSLRGPTGGFILARPAEKITALEIYEAVDGVIIDGNCLLGENSCQFAHCILGQLALGVNDLVRKTFSSSTLADLSGSMNLRVK